MTWRRWGAVAACMAVLLSTTPAWAKKLSPTKIAARARKNMRESEPDRLARLLTYEEVLAALEQAPDSARDVARAVSDRAREIGLKWRGDLPTMKKLTDGLRTLGDRTLKLHPESGAAYELLAFAHASVGRVAQVTRTSDGFSPWQTASDYARRASQLDDKRRAEHLMRAARFLREGAPLAEDREPDALLHALNLIVEARADRKDDEEMRREHAFVHLGTAKWAIRAGNESKAKSEYNKALALVEIGEKPSREAKNAYNSVVAFGHQHGLVSKKEGFVGKPGTNTIYWDVMYPEARDWKFVLAMEFGAIFRIKKIKPAGGTIEIVMRRWDHRREYGPNRTGGDNPGGISNWRQSIWVEKYKDEQLKPALTKGMPPFTQGAKSFRILGKLFGQPARFQAWTFPGEETRVSYTLEIEEVGQFPEGDIDSEVRYILSTMKEKKPKKK